MTKEKNQGLTDMTVGSATKHIVRFAIPLLIGNMFQQLYNMVDSIVVGRFVGKTALAAVGTAFPVIFLLSSLFMGLGIGAMVMVSQYYGAGDNAKMKATVDTIYTGLMIGVVPLSLFGIFISGPVLHLLNVPPDTYGESHIYMLIVLGGLIGTLGYNANAGILQGLGDSRTPLLFLVIACALNIVLDLFFVLVIPLGVAGVAIATVIAQIFSWLFGIFYINKKYPELHISPFGFRFDKELFKKIVKLGVPAGIQQALFSIGVMALQRLVNSYGSDFMAGYNGANKLDTFAFMPIQSFATAATTFVGQNIGAKKPERVKNGTISALVLSCIFSIAAALILMPFGDFLMRMFSTEQAVIDSGMAYLTRIMPFYSMLAIMFVLNSVMRGAGEMMVPLISSILSLWLARVPAAYILAATLGRDNMHYCFAIGWVLGLLLTVPYFFSGRWKKNSVI
ncbi:MAG: MATE family efflux transporter [Oscillospiraceae bacterium]